MADAELTIKNYRCFSRERPARLHVGSGFTAFVGPNNGGKSSLLRFFYEFRELFQGLSVPNTLLETARGSRRAFSLAAGVQEPSEMFNNANDGDIEIEITIEGLIYRFTIPRDRNEWLVAFPGVGVDPNVLQLEDTRLVGGGATIELRPLMEFARDAANTVFVGAFRNAINVGTNANYYDIQIGQAFVQRWDDLKNSPPRSNNVAVIRLTREIQEIFGFNELEINAAPNKETLRVIVDGQSYRLDELGAGLAHFILVMANVAVRSPAWALLDEPELNLHPSMQLRFLTTVAAYASRGVIFATHSMGLARSAAESVYVVRATSPGVSDVTLRESTPRLAELAGELSYGGYTDLGYDNILLVEGVHDVRTVQQWLRKLGKDAQVVLLPLGGSQLIRDGVDLELEELARLSKHVYALIDSERSLPGAGLQQERQRFFEICESSGISCTVLERRAIENYFTDRAVKAAFGDQFRALQPYELIADTDHPWPKSLNWKVAREMYVEELADTDLGNLLAAI